MIDWKEAENQPGIWIEKLFCTAASLTLVMPLLKNDQLFGPTKSIDHIHTQSAIMKCRTIAKGNHGSWTWCFLRISDCELLFCFESQYVSMNIQEILMGFRLCNHLKDPFMCFNQYSSHIFQLTQLILFTKRLSFCNKNQQMNPPVKECVTNDGLIRFYLPENKP